MPPALAHISRQAIPCLPQYNSPDVSSCVLPSCVQAGWLLTLLVCVPQLEASDNAQAAADTHRRGGRAGRGGARAGQRGAVLLSDHGAGVERPLPIRHHAPHGGRNQPTGSARGECCRRVRPIYSHGITPGTDAILQRQLLSLALVGQVPQAVEEHIGSKWTAADLLLVNGTEEEVEALREAVLKSRAAAKALRLEKKAGKGASKAVVQSSDGDCPVSPAVVADSLKRSLEVRSPHRRLVMFRRADDLLLVHPHNMCADCPAGDRGAAGG